MTNQYQKHTSFSILVLFSLLFVFTSCDKDDDEPNNPYNGKTQVEFNPDLTYGTMVDQEGNEYKTIKIGNQTWMAENLRTTTFRNGEAIPEIIGGMDWVAATEAAWCNYYGNYESIATYGRLYNWYAATDERNIAPEGWHVPSESEWQTLVNYLIKNGYNADSSNDTAPNKLAKALATTNLWNESQNNYDLALGSNSFPEKKNASGFSAAPSGIRIGMNESINNVCFWWSADITNSGIVYSKRLYFEHAHFGSGGRHRQDGLSIRCIKDN